MVPDRIIQEDIMARRRRAGLPNRDRTGRTGSRQTRQSAYLRKGSKEKSIVYFNRGMKCQKRGEYEEAVAFYDMAIEADPTNMNAYSNKGKVLAITENPDESLVCLEKAIKLASAAAPDKSHVDIYTNMVAILYELGRHNEAVSYLDMASDCLDKNDPNDRNWVLVSCLFEELGEEEKAIACRRTGSKVAWKCYKEGAEMMAKGRYEESAACLDRAISEDPSFAEAYYAKGQVVRSLGRLDDAAACFRQAIKADPGLASAYSDLAMEMSRAGKGEEALKLVDTALRKSPDFGFAHFCKGVILANTGQHKEAITCFDHAIEINAEEVLVYVQKGISHWMLGEIRRATQCLDYALELDPHNTHAQKVKSELEQSLEEINIEPFLDMIRDGKIPRP